VESREGITADAAGQDSGTRPGPIRRLYDWVLKWADRPQGPIALAGLSFAESSFFPLPPDPLLMALCLGAVKKSFRFALITTVASVFGGVVAYGIGAGFWSVVDQWFFSYVPGVTPESFEAIRVRFEDANFLAVFFMGLTPLPYKLITLSAGAFAVHFPTFLAASVLSRGLRFFLVAGLIRAYGQPIKGFIDKYFNILSIVFGVLLIGGFVVVKMVLH
jgi:membrane protein YqaA with SNARE-associated domain